MKTLIVVDLQRDFYHPEGALYVKGGEEAMKEVVELVKNDRTINQVVLTVDWHNPEDHSFEVNGGTWPIHCVQYSVGASLPPELMTAIIGRGFKSVDGSYYLAGVKYEVTKQFLAGTYDVFQKGDVPGEEEYGAFAEYDGLEDGDSDIVCMTGASGDSCAYLNLKNDVVVAGLAGDYCVLETAKNLKEILDGEDGEGKLMMYLPGIASIDDGSKLKEWMAKNEVTSYDPNEKKQKVMENKNDYKKIFESSVTGLLDYLKKNGLESMVLGISGGIDSSVCAVICREVTRRDPTLSFYGVSLPCCTNTEGETSTADLIGKAFVQNYWTHGFQEEFEAVEKWCSNAAGSSTPISQGNIKARLRMIYLRNLAGLKRGISIGTSNLTEELTGFFTIAGDVGDVDLIAELWKHEVYGLAEWMVENKCETEEEKEALKFSIGLTPTDGNGVKEGGDLAQIAPALSSYEELDEILMANERYKKKPTEANLYLLNLITDKYGEETVTQILARVKGSEFKRKPMPVRLTLEGIDRGEPKKEDLLKHVSSAD